MPEVARLQGFIWYESGCFAVALLWKAQPGWIARRKTSPRRAWIEMLFFLDINDMVPIHLIWLRPGTR